MIKKYLFSFIIIFALFVNPVIVFSSQLSQNTAPNSFSVFVNNKKVLSNINFTIIKNQKMFPALSVFKAVGAAAKWDAVKNRLDVKYSGKKYVYYANKKTVYIGVSRLSIPTPPRVVNQSPMIPASILEQITEMNAVLDTKKHALYLSGEKAENPSDESKSTTDADLSQKIVVIDPGHGGSETGAIYGGINEKDLNLDVAKRLYSTLKKQGIQTYMTRETDKTVALSERTNMANSLHASLFVSIHHNALPNDKSYVGTETLYSPYGSSIGNVSSKRLAEITQQSLVSRLGTKDRGIISRTNLYVLHRTKMPAIIAEIGYMTNSKERSKLANSQFEQKAAEALSSSIISTLNKI